MTHIVDHLGGHSQRPSDSPAAWDSHFAIPVYCVGVPHSNLIRSAVAPQGI
jgi:hypothetical protein